MEEAVAGSVDGAGASIRHWTTHPLDLCEVDTWSVPCPETCLALTGALANLPRQSLHRHTFGSHVAPGTLTTEEAVAGSVDEADASLRLWTAALLDLCEVDTWSVSCPETRLAHIGSIEDAFSTTVQSSSMLFLFFSITAAVATMLWATAELSDMRVAASNESLLGSCFQSRCMGVDPVSKRR